MNATQTRRPLVFARHLLPYLFIRALTAHILV